MYTHECVYMPLCIGAMGIVGYGPKTLNALH